MKRIFLLLFVFSSISIYSQTLPIKFIVTETADIKLGEAWDFNTKPLNSEINLSFDGKVLKMVYSTGKVYLEIPVISHENKSVIVIQTNSRDVSILKVERDGLIQYILIENNHLMSGDYYSVMIPYYEPSGQLISYARFVQ